MKSIQLPDRYTVIAPDGSEIRELLTMKGGSMVHCKLPPGAISMAVVHQTVEEVWYFLKGSGQVWRKRGDQETTVEVESGMCIDIELGTHFQFRNTGNEDLCFIISTIPPWPGGGEAMRVQDHWNIDGNA